jgi:hypothetical protein
VHVILEPLDAGDARKRSSQRRREISMVEQASADAGCDAGQAGALPGSGEE